MGWTQPFETFNSDAEIKEYLDKGFVKEVKVLKSAKKGSWYYALIQYTNNGKVVRTIAFDKVKKFRDGTIAYKPMDESMGVYFYDVPLSYIKETTEPPNEYAKQWREEVIKRHDAKPKRKTTKPSMYKYNNAIYKTQDELLTHLVDDMCVYSKKRNPIIFTKYYIKVIDGVDVSSKKQFVYVPDDGLYLAPSSVVAKALVDAIVFKYNASSLISKCQKIPTKLDKDGYYVYAG